MNSENDQPTPLPEQDLRLLLEFLFTLVNSIRWPIIMNEFRISFHWYLRIALLTFLSFRTQAQDAEQGTPDATIPEIISLSDVPARSEEVVRKLNGEFSQLVKRPVPSQNIVLIDSLNQEFIEIKEFMGYALDRNYSYQFIERFVSKWDEFIASTSIPASRLNNYSSDLSDIREELISMRLLWNNTLTSMRKLQDIPVEVEVRAREVLIELDKFSGILSDSLNVSIAHQNKLVDLKIKAEENRDRLKEDLQQQFNKLVTKRSDPLFSIPTDSTNSTSFFENNESYLEYNLSETIAYANKNFVQWVELFAAFAFTLILIFWMKRRVTKWEGEETEHLIMGKNILKYPFIAALFFTLLLSLGIWDSPPIPINVATSLIIVICFMILARTIIVEDLRRGTYLFGVMFILTRLSDLFIIDDLRYRIFQLIINLIMISFLVWFQLNKSKIVLSRRYDTLWFSLLKFIAPFFLIILSLSALGNLVGYLYISFLINNTVLDSFLIGILFGVVYSSLSSIFIIFLSTSFARNSILVRTYHDLIISRVLLLFKGLYFFFWGYFTLKWFALLDLSKQLLLKILSWGITIDEFNFTLQNVFSFLIVLIISWAISNFIRLLLRDEILARIELPKGVPLAVSSLTYYMMITTGFFIALMSLGFDIQNLGLLAGALGVGIGFGLQNIVNNFISGLILIFERPITIGDIVQLETIEGEVVAIGIRSSKIQQYDGSVLIVPNADLISNKVVNRTLTDHKRRFELTIFTPDDVENELVLKTITTAAREIENVLKDPPAKTYFVGTEDQSRRFKLYYWVDREILDTKSQVSLEVHAALHSIGVKVTSDRKIQITSKGGQAPGG